MTLTGLLHSMMIIGNGMNESAYGDDAYRLLFGVENQLFISFPFIDRKKREEERAYHNHYHHQ
jgi:hypothetical protein